tara:strand:- start:5341 stop:5532 length:192 start_codon:yes stop_codon:yes gene_type:complete
MKVGDLVKITRASIGIPKGTIGLIVKVTDGGEGYDLCHVHFMSRLKISNNHPRPFLPSDLQIL